MQVYLIDSDKETPWRNLNLSSNVMTTDYFLN